jgi:NodT family efflux transporter outer membrane factor (OMF) lipoprotein
MKIKMNKIIPLLIVSLLMIGGFQACKGPEPLQSKLNAEIPEQYEEDIARDSMDVAQLDWKTYFKDPYLVDLIDSALMNNREYAIMLQEIQVEKNEVRARKGEYLPFLGVMAGAATDKPGRYTRNGSVEANGEIEAGKDFPEPLSNYHFGAYASWEIDIWKKLRNSKKAAVLKYLASSEGRNYMRTRMVAEIAASYYQLLALDNQLEILQQNIAIQKKALTIVRLQKEAAQLTELAVKRFEAEVAKNQSYQYELKQAIVESENRINFLVGRFPQKVERSAVDLEEVELDSLYAGLPLQLIQNRPDLRAAELRLEATHLDVRSAKANFYPSISLDAAFGYEAYRGSVLLQSPESMLFGLAGQLMAPLLNRNAIKAQYQNANARQQLALLEYEKTLFEAYSEVINQLKRLENLNQNYELKTVQVDALDRSIDLSIGLFKSARADYMEVLLTQREALEARVELIKTKQEQLETKINLYQALGGG